jgi:hypothetical protein
MRSARTTLVLCVFVPLLLAAAVVPAPARPGATAREAGGLQSAAFRLQRGLRAEAAREAALREPAATAGAQVGIVIEHLRGMSPVAALDPHYLPALIAAGRAYMAVSGRDPLTQTALNPDYDGLEAELAAGEAGLTRHEVEAGALSARARELKRALIRSERRTRRLERLLRRSR